MSVFLLNFLMKMADKLVGKGLGFWIIFKLVVYSLSWMFVLAVPMAVLVATLMAFGNMTHNNEIAIMKSTGISLYKIMIPPLLASIVIFFLLVQFNNNVYPNANHALRILMQDISNQKPTLSLVPGVFSQDISRYSILSRKINSKTNKLKDVVIYDHSDPSVLNVVTAKNGNIYFSADRKKLILNLFNGEIHTSKRSDYKTYRKLKFKKHKIAMDAEQFSFQQTTYSSSRGDRELSARAILKLIDSIKTLNKREFKRMDKRLGEFILNDTIKTATVKYKRKNLRAVLFRVDDKIRGTKNSFMPMLRRINQHNKRIDNYLVEVHKKYSIPFACIVFILIGVPLGTMTRKGGFGVAAAISLVFFLIYWAFLIGGEKLSDRGLLSPFWGMWSANILLGILGIILIYKTTNERIELKFEFIKKLIPKYWRDSTENN